MKFVLRNELEPRLKSIGNASIAFMINPFAFTNSTRANPKDKMGYCEMQLISQYSLLRQM